MPTPPAASTARSSRTGRPPRGVHRVRAARARPVRQRQVNVAVVRVDGHPLRRCSLVAHHGVGWLPGPDQHFGLVGESRRDERGLAAGERREKRASRICPNAGLADLFEPTSSVSTNMRTLRELGASRV
jgi:hypothetical protein